MRLNRTGRIAAIVATAVGLSVSVLTGAGVAPGDQARFTATAYCDSGVTKSGVRTRRGIIAADPAHLPVGSVVRVREVGHPRYEGIYTVMDTGGLVRGRRIDLYMPDCHEARLFGLRRRVLVRVLRLGWSPQASMPPADVSGSGGRRPLP
jgi:3D (Asp-Asp-Asp) domain-containing protein